VKGQFTRVKGVLNLDETDVTNSRVEASIDCSLDQHSRRAAGRASQGVLDFFDVEKFPALSFKSRE